MNVEVIRQENHWIYKVVLCQKIKPWLYNNILQFLELMTETVSDKHEFLLNQNQFDLLISWIQQKQFNI